MKHLPVRQMPFDAAWLASARARLARLEISQGNFARWVGCAQGLVSGLFGKTPPDHWSSDYVERISAALEIDLPLLAQWHIEGLRFKDDPEALAAFLAMLRWQTRIRGK